MIQQLCRKLFYTFINGFRQIAKKIAVKNLRNSNKQLHVDIVAFEYIVHIRTVAMQLSGKPSYGTFLAAQFSLYLSTYMFHTAQKKWT